MKIKIHEVVTDYEGKAITMPPDDKALTYFDVFVNALNSQINAELIPAETKSKIYQLTKKLYSSNEPNLTTDQLTLIKERVGKGYAPMVYGKVCEVIDGTDEKDPQEVKTPQSN